ncbi:hypothetical protein [Sphingomonas sp. KC8]|uniref:hypothetical protein n=1 Tax=Sphingomonas sp. KC8 TaxID=1030157 RepID=UPI001110E95D|nr:hypothetical protein [Sphingomonas sp. KC8]
MQFLQPYDCFFELSKTELVDYPLCSAQQRAPGLFRPARWRLTMKMFEAATSLALAIASQALAVGVILTF